MPENSIDNDKILDLVKGNKDHYYIRDLDDQFVFCNKAMSDWHDFAAPENMYGKGPNDCRLIAAVANDFITFDKKIIEKRSSETMFTQIQDKNADWVVTCDNKYPHYNSAGDIIGVVGTSVVFTKDMLPPLLRWHFSHNVKPQTTIIKESFDDSPLTVIENEVLYFYLRKISPREIERLIGVSTVLIESHICALKKKIGCVTHAQVVEYARQHELLDIIPIGLIAGSSLVESPDTPVFAGDAPVNLSVNHDDELYYGPLLSTLIAK